MRLGRTFTTFLSWALVASATILENGQVRENSYPGQLEPVTLDDSWRDYPADAPEISYKGRWDSQHISCMFPIRFLFPRLLFLTLTLTLERTSGWSYVLQLSPILSLSPCRSTCSSLTIHTVQIAGVAVAKDAVLTKPPTFEKRVEIIGGSLASGQFATYETISSWSFLFANGLGNVEYGITAYPGVCLADEQCYGGSSRGVGWYWHRASDPGSRARAMYDHSPEKWDVKAEQPADLVIIQMGGNDHRHPNEIPGRDYYHAYVELVEDIHSNWPNAIILLMSQWGTFSKEGKKYVGSTYYQEETRQVNEHFKDRGFVYYFPTEGLLQHNDINPKNHLTDVGHIKVASHLLQWVKLVLRWNLEPTGEVQSGTTYWNDQQEY
ncbi:Pc13g04220 [Penicillium rubens Wisconsin 54-1255]|uniref:Pc13g04220 protein n=1 Tax=Penicillium rubens (strain ATCC 28089 / DSM 1075 / NRRL 1951 / Wisconsin 54-1255) TaxID=500485 RepID=B6H271_PENRW|nr:Pc13g04220 [Penicillium rubens Wisconsin 54-1255]